uniref:PiggyBac transposable element-derived protein domain-containing protein n=1 Tax=Clastoptera arizonana TaxID=38151 RepID=A0A1B6C0U6_9HEMI
MTDRKIFSSSEEILAELIRQAEESDEGSLDFSENPSETEDEILSNIDAEDIFDCDDEGDDQSDMEDKEYELGKDEETIWTNVPFRSKFARTSSSNIITHLPGPRGEAREIVDEDKLFSLYITDEMIENIVHFTNDEMERSRIKYTNTDLPFLRPTNVIETKALIGLLYMSGVLKNTGLNQNDMFSELYGPPIFRSTMPKKRFQFLLQNLRFDDKRTRNLRKADKFAPFRKIWDVFIANCLKYFSPSEYLTVDETLLSFRGRCPFKMFIPSKPDKYGLKIISICDARTFYFISGIPYVGREQNKKKGDLSFPTQYVLRLTESVAGSNRNVTCDNWFTSYELAEELSKKKLTLVGTLRKNKRETPPSMLLPARPGTSKFMYQDNKTLVSYNPKKNKKVLLLSSMHDQGIINTAAQKPEIVEFYNLTKGGVDVWTN